MCLFLWCLPFSGTHCPNLWRVLSEALTDLGNDLLSGENCNAEELCSQHSNKLNEPTLLEDSMTFVHALPTDVVSRPYHWDWIDD